MAFIESDQEGVIRCLGSWTLLNLMAIQREISQLALPDQQEIIIDGRNIEAVDSAGALQLHRIREEITIQHKKSSLSHFENRFLKLIDATSRKAPEIKQAPPIRVPKGLFYEVGKQVIEKSKELLTFLSFIGEFCILLQRILFKPKRWPFKAFLKTLEEGGCDALPIIALLSFLIGVVIAYQLSLQLKLYGANVFIVNLSGMANLREFGPLISAVIIAGRTTSSFTAQVGLMKVNEEIDALYAMGLSPIVRIAIPRVLGMILVMPLLTVWADAFGVFGSMIMADNMLNIHMADFLSRFDDVIAPSDFWTGIAKAPVFGLILAFVGCFQGFRVSYSSDSIGHQTTKSVVQAVFLVIIADAIFSILFSDAGL